MMSASQNRQMKRMMTDVKKAQAEQPVIIVLDDLDFSWQQEEITLFLGRWRTGQPLEKIAEVLRPDLDPRDALDETTLLAMHLDRKGMLT